MINLSHLLDINLSCFWWNLICCGEKLCSVVQWRKCLCTSCDEVICNKCFGRVL